MSRNSAPSTSRTPPNTTPQSTGFDVTSSEGALPNLVFENNGGNSTTHVSPEFYEPTLFSLLVLTPQKINTTALQTLVLNLILNTPIESLVKSINGENTNFTVITTISAWLNDYKSDATLHDFIYQAAFTLAARAKFQAWATMPVLAAGKSMHNYFAAYLMSLLDSIAPCTQQLKDACPIEVLLFRLLKNPTNCQLMELLAVSADVIPVATLNDSYNCGKHNETGFRLLLDILEQGLATGGDALPQLITTVTQILTAYFNSVHDWDRSFTFIQKLIGLVKEYSDHSELIFLLQLVIERSTLFFVTDVTQELESLIQQSEHKKEVIDASGQEISPVALSYFQSLLDQANKQLAEFYTQVVPPKTKEQESRFYQMMELFLYNHNDEAVQGRLLEIMPNLSVSLLTSNFTATHLESKKGLKRQVVLTLLEIVMIANPQNQRLRDIAAQVALKVPAESWETAVSLGREKTTADYFATFLLTYINTVLGRVASISPDTPFGQIIAQLEIDPQNQFVLKLLQRACSTASASAVLDQNYQFTSLASGLRQCTKLLDNALNSGYLNLQIPLTVLLTRYFEQQEQQSWDGMLLDEDAGRYLFEMLLTHQNNVVIHQLTCKIIPKLSPEELQVARAVLNPKISLAPKDAALCKVDQAIGKIEATIRREQEAKIAEQGRKARMAAEKDERQKAKHRAQQEKKEAKKPRAKKAKAKPQSTQVSCITTTQGLANHEDVRGAYNVSNHRLIEMAAKTSVLLFSLMRFVDQLSSNQRLRDAFTPHLTPTFVAYLSARHPELMADLFTAFISTAKQASVDDPFVQAMLSGIKDWSECFWSRRSVSDSDTAGFPLAQLCVALWYQPENPIYLTVLETAKDIAPTAAWRQTWESKNDDIVNTWSPATLLTDKLVWAKEESRATLLQATVDVFFRFTESTWPSGQSYRRGTGEEITFDHPLRIFAVLLARDPINHDIAPMDQQGTKLLLRVLLHATEHSSTHVWTQGGVNEAAQSTPLAILAPFTQTLEDTGDVDLQRLKFFVDSMVSARAQERSVIALPQAGMLATPRPKDQKFNTTLKTGAERKLSV